MFKLCACGKLINKNEECGSCKSKSNKEYDKHKRDKQSKKFYNSVEWKKARRTALIRDRYLCVQCFNEGKIVFANIVHHIKEVKEHQELKLDLENLITLCANCHAKLHKTSTPPCSKKTEGRQ